MEQRNTYIDMLEATEAVKAVPCSMECKEPKTTMDLQSICKRFTSFAQEAGEQLFMKLLVIRKILLNHDRSSLQVLVGLELMDAPRPRNP